jgi:hypothetical protein
MELSTILEILSLINGLIDVAKDAPIVVQDAKSLLAKIEAHVQASKDAGLKANFADTQAKLRSGDFDFSQPAPAGQDSPVVAP